MRYATLRSVQIIIVPALILPQLVLAQTYEIPASVVGGGGHCPANGGEVT